MLHFNVTEHPTARWTGQPLREACQWDAAPRFLLRDRDGFYGDDFTRIVHSMGTEQVLTAAGSPWQNPYAEWLIGSIRRGCLDHLIVFHERHLRNVLRDYFASYHDSRTHLGLGKDAPNTRNVEAPSRGVIVEIPEVGGQHHRYTAARPEHAHGLLPGACASRPRCARQPRHPHVVQAKSSDFDRQ